MRQHEESIRAAEAEGIEGELGSISPGEMTDEEFERLYAEETSHDRRPPVNPAETVHLSTENGRTDQSLASGPPR